MKRFLLFVLIVFSSSPAFAALSVFELNHVCTKTDNESQAICRYYILGVADGGGLEATLAGDKTHFCIPAGVKFEGLELIIKSALQRDLLAHPQDVTMPAVSFIAAVFLKAFPCPALAKPQEVKPEEIVPETPSAPEATPVPEAPKSDVAPAANPDQTPDAQVPKPN